MIVFLTTGEHTYTVKRLCEEAGGLDVSVLPYEQVLAATRLPVATYVFADVDRLPLAARLRAGMLYRQLTREGSGCRALNDPARVRSRYSLLRALHREGLNAFNAYRADEGATPERFPVFVRFEQEHGAPLSDLLPDRAALDRALAERIEEGVPEEALLVVEYCAEPIAEGVFRKLAAYRIGARLFPGETIIEDKWCVKYGRRGLATAEQFREDLEMVRDFPHRERVMRAFEIGGIEYGRADFGIVDGRPQIYEINTNPMFGRLVEHPSPIRTQSLALVRSNVLDALRAVDSRLRVS